MPRETSSGASASAAAPSKMTMPWPRPAHGPCPSRAQHAEIEDVGGTGAMKAVVYKGPNQVAVENVEDPRIEAPTDVLVKVTSTAICGSDLHMYEGRTAAEAGIVFGHENMGVVEEGGAGVATIKKGG